MHLGVRQFFASKYTPGRIDDRKAKWLTFHPVGKNPVSMTVRPGLRGKLKVNCIHELLVASQFEVCTQKILGLHVKPCRAIFESAKRDHIVRPSDFVIEWNCVASQPPPF